MEKNHSTPDSVENKSSSESVKEETIKALIIMAKISKEVRTKRNSKMMCPEMDKDLNDKNYVNFIENYNLCEDEIGVNGKVVTITKNEKEKITNEIVDLFLYTFASILVWFQTMENVLKSTESFPNHVTDNA